MDQQIAAVRAALAAVESAIAQTEAALNTASVPQDMAALRSVLVDLKAERAKLELQLANLEAAAVEVQPLGEPVRTRSVGGPAPGGGRMSATSRTQMKSIEKELESTLADRTVAKATIALATKVMRNARRLRAIGEEPEPTRRSAVKRSATARRPAPAAGARRRRSRSR
jgi:hypothetical protein